MGTFTCGGTWISRSRAIHDALLEAGEAKQHRWVPDSGWVTFHIRSAADVEHAIRLMRLSYLRYALKAVPNPDDFLKRETERLALRPNLAALLKPFLPTRVA